MEKVIIVGVRQDLAENIPSSFKGKVRVYSKEHPLKEEDIIVNIPTNNVYISIDKDVLAKSETLVNWDQGNMNLEQLIKLVRYIDIYKNICGIDICGEYSVSPAESFLYQSKKAIFINDRTNRIILNTLMKLNFQMSNN